MKQIVLVVALVLAFPVGAFAQSLYTPLYPRSTNRASTIHPTLTGSSHIQGASEHLHISNGIGKSRIETPRDTLS